jgi:hypothetical protein
MAHLVVRGGTRLAGRVTVGGNKNAALPLLAACLLTPDTCELRNVPQIRDVAVMIQLLRSLGATVEGEGTSTLRVTCARIDSGSPDSALVGRLRGSVLLMGALLARVGWAALAAPGGDFPARRSITTHLCALEALGARGIDHRLEAPAGLRATSLYLPEASVTGTETALLAAALANGTSEFRHAACEPHVVELCEMLSAMGAAVEGAGRLEASAPGLGRCARATRASARASIARVRLKRCWQDSCSRFRRLVSRFVLSVALGLLVSACGLNPRPEDPQASGAGGGGNDAGANQGEGTGGSAAIGSGGSGGVSVPGSMGGAAGTGGFFGSGGSTAQDDAGLGEGASDAGASDAGASVDAGVLDGSPDDASDGATVPSDANPLSDAGED